MLRPVLEPGIPVLFSLVKQDFPGMVQLTIHGELFGGEYPHPDVAPVPGVQAVQTGVYYCPDIRFCAFDMAVINRENTKTYIDFPAFTGYAEKVSLFFSHTLFTGSFHDVMLYDISFESTIAPLLGFPSLGPGNRAEGIVIKPERSFFLDVRGKKVRPVIKRKIPEFSEDKRYHKAEKWNTWAQKSGQTGNTGAGFGRKSIIVNETFVEQEIAPLVTAQRLANAVSKTGRLCKKNRARILRALVEDVIEELAAGFHELYHDLAEEDKKKIYTIVKIKCKELIKNA
jgi:Rnl2 family RNA ligase